MIAFRLDCGHTGHTSNPLRVGIWVSCWALMLPGRGCQTQRKVVSATGWQQGRLW